MIKTKLKPYVHKIKGAKNFAFYDLMKGIFYTVSPDGSVDELKKSLKEAGLTFETEGIVPKKIEIDLTQEMDRIHLHKLQIRLNGKNEDNCLNRKKTGEEKRFMTKETLALIHKQIRHIPVRKIRIEAETYEKEKMEYILNEFHYSEANVFIGEGLSREEQDYLKMLSGKRGGRLTFIKSVDKDIKSLNVDTYTFFYNHIFNPCLGHQIAIDCRGEIKPCLWWKETIGRIGSDNLKDMINMEVFDPYWKLTKDMIETCKDCELRYACGDCRLSPAPGEDPENTAGTKPGYCDYDPFKGESVGPEKT